MRQIKITPRHALRALAACLLFCTLTQTAVSQTSPKRGKTEQAVKPQPKVESDDERVARGRAQAEKAQKAWDAKSVNTMKSICGNC
jgi:hypothetical protein